MGRQMTVTEAAARLGVSKRRVRAMIDEGTVPAKKIGPIWIIEADDLAGVKVYRKAGRPPKTAIPPDARQ